MRSQLEAFGLLVLLAACPVAALEVTAVGAVEVLAAPGEVLTFAYRVFNSRGQSLRLRPEVTAPDGWKLLTGDQPFDLGPGAADIRLVSHALPVTATAGEYVLHYGVSGGARTTTVVAEARRVVLSTIDRLRLELLDHPTYVLAGDSYEIQYRLTNESNRSHRVALEWAQSGEALLVTDRSEVDLAPGESKVVAALAEIPVDIRLEDEPTTSLTAVSLTADGALREASTTSVTVLPVQTRSTRRRHHLDGLLSLGTILETDAHDSTRTRPHGAIDLSGDLDEDGERYLSLRLQGPYINPRFGPSVQEDLRLELATPRFDLLIGDYDPLYSRLRHGPRGRGARLALHGDLWEVGVRFLRSDRRSSIRVEESAVRGEMQFGEQTIGLEYLRRSVPLQSEKSEFLGLTVALRPRENLSLRFSLDFGRRLDTSPRATDGWGADVEIVGEQERWSYNVAYLYGDDGFPGQYAGRSSLYGGINAKLTRRLSVRSNARRGRAQEEPDVIYTVPPAETDFVSGLSFRLASKATLSLEERSHSRVEISEVAALDLEERTHRLSLDQRLGEGQVSLRVETGDGHDRLEGSSFALDRYTLDASYRYRENLDLQASVESTQETALDGSRQSHLSGLLRARWQVTAGLTVEGYYRQRERQFRTETNTTYTRVRVARALPRGHEVAFELSRYRTTGLAGRQNDAALLSYTLPVSAPATRRQGVGAVHGRIRDENSGQPLANVIVRLGGAAARTRTDGSFSVAALSTGRYPLVVDAARAGYRMVPSAANPELIDVVHGEDQPLDLWLTQGGRLRGVVTRGLSEAERWAMTDRSLLADVKEEDLPVAGVLVELTDGHTTRRRITDAGGRFVFETLRPGDWTLRAIGAPLGEPEPAPEARKIVITPAGEHEITIRLRNRHTEHKRISTDRNTPLEVIGFSGAGGGA